MTKKIIQFILAIVHMAVILLPLWITLLSKNQKYDRLVDVLFVMYAVIPAGWYLCDGCILTNIEDTVAGKSPEERTSFVVDWFGPILKPMFKLLRIEPSSENVDKFFVVLYIVFFVYLLKKLYKRKY